MNGQYTCLTCGAAIPLDDINVASDIALCRKCGNASAFSLIYDASGLADAGTGEPPRGVRVERDLMGGGVSIIYKRIDRSVFFLIPFTLIWSGVSIGGLYGTQLMNQSFDWKMSLFGIPFLIGTIFLVSSTLMGLFGKHTITLKRGEGTVFRGIGKLGRTRTFTYSRDARISLRPSIIRHNNGSCDEIEVASQGKTFGMCVAIPTDPQRFIAGLLQREIARGS